MIWSMAVASSNPQKLLYGTDTSGIWRSDDSGTTWSISTTGLKTLGTVDIVYDPDNCNIAYVATCLHDCSIISHVNSNVGIYKTTDGGVTWSQVLEASFYRLQSNKLIKFGAINGLGQRTIYVGTHSTGVYKSEDNGTSWTNLGRTGDQITDLYVNDSTIAEVSAQSGVMVSTNGGSTWAARNTGLPSVAVSSLAVDPNNTQIWFAVLNTRTVYKSTNAGLNWASTGGPSGCTGTFMKLLFGAYNPSGDPVLYLTLNENSNTIRYSKDLGATWSTPAIDNSIVLRKDNTGYWAESTTVHPTDLYTVWTCLDGVIYKSTNTSMVSWFPSNSGSSGFRIKTIVFDNNGDITYAGMIDHGMLKVAPGYTTTEYPPFNHLTGVVRYGGGWACHGIAVDPSNSNIVYAKIGNWGSDLTIEKSTDAGTTWTMLSGTAGNYVDFLEYHPQNDQVIYGGKLRSTNNGAAWTQLTYPVQAVYQPNGDIVYSADQTTIYKSTDKGSTWTTLISGLNEIQKITPDYAVPNRLWVGTFNSGIIRLDDSTPTYIGQAQGLVPSVNGNICIFHVAQDPNNSQHFVAAGVDNVAMGPSPGLFESTDGGTSWSLVPNTPGICDIWQVQFHKTQPFVYLCTSNGLLVYDWSKRSRSTPTPTP